MGTLAFSGQIFCDFAGYSTTAIGAAMCLGFAMPDNFRFPYAAIGFSDFWRRWHITLSSWLRDYLYIPLGGNRHGEARTYFALMATMLLGGLWHGASWTFVAWGGLHGLYLAVERVLRARFAGYVPGPLALFGLGLLTYALINITWVFFRAEGFGQAWGVLRGMFGVNVEAQPILTTAHLAMVALIVGGIVIAHWLMRTRTLETMLARRHPAALSAALGADGVRGGRRTGGGQCLHLLPVLRRRGNLDEQRRHHWNDRTLRASWLRAAHCVGSARRCATGTRTRHSAAAVGEDPVGRTGAVPVADDGLGMVLARVRCNTGLPQ